MYLDSLTWQKVGKEDDAYLELADVLAVDELDLRETFEVAAEEAVLPFFGGGSLIRFSAGSLFGGEQRQEVYALRVPRRPPPPSDGEAGKETPPPQTRRYLLDGRSNPIHGANEWCDVPLTHDNAADYARFFCLFVHGDDGAFNIVERAPDAPGLAQGTRYQLRAAQLDPAGPDTDSFRLRAPIVYGGNLFEADLVVLPDGEIKMVHDLSLSAVLPGAALGAPKLDAWLAIVDEITRRARWQTVHVKNIDLASARWLTEYAAWSSAAKAIRSHSDDFESLADVRILSVSRLPQTFLPMTDVARIRYRKGDRVSTSVFLRQCLDRTLPEFWPVGRCGGNLTHLLREGGAHVAVDLDVERFRDFALFLAADVLDTASLTTRPSPEGKVEPRLDVTAHAYATVHEMPVALAARARTVAASWAERQQDLVTIVAALDAVVRQQTTKQTLPPNLINSQKTILDQVRPLLPGGGSSVAPRFGVEAGVDGGHGPRLFVERATDGTPPHRLEWSFAFDPLAPVEYGALPEAVADRVAKLLIDDLSTAFEGFKRGMAALRHLGHPSLPRTPSDWPDQSIFEQTIDDPTRSSMSRAVFVELRFGGDQARTRLLAADVAFEASSCTASIQSFVEIGSWERVPAPAETERAPAFDPLFEGGVDDAFEARAAFARAAYASELDQIAKRPPNPDQTTTAEIEEGVRKTGALILEGRLLKEGISLQGLRSAGAIRLKSVTLKNCTIIGDLDLRGVSIENDLLLENVSVAEGVVDLSGVTVSGAAVISGLIVADLKRRPDPNRVALNLEEASIKGAVKMVACSLGGALNLDFAKVGFYLQAWLLRCSALSANRLHIERGSFFVSAQDLVGVGEGSFGIIVDGDVSITNAEIHGNAFLDTAFVKGRLNTAGSDIQGDLRVGTFYYYDCRCSVGSMTLDGTTVGSAISLETMTVRHGVLVQNVQAKTLSIGASSAQLMRGGQQPPDVMVGRTIDIVHSRIAGALTCRGLLARRELRIDNSRLSSILLDGLVSVHRFPRLWPPGTVPTRSPSDRGHTGLLVPSQLRHGFAMRGGRVDRSIRLAACMIRDGSMVQQSVDLSGVTIGSHIDLWSDEYSQSIPAVEGVDDVDVVPIFGGYDERARGWPVLWLHSAHPDWEAKLEEWRAGLGQAGAPPEGAIVRRRPADDVPVAEQRAAAPPVNLEAQRKNIEEAQASASNVVTRIRGRTSIRQCSIKGDVRLRNAHAEARHVTPAGPTLRVDRCNVHGNLDLTGLQVDADGPAPEREAAAVAVTDTVVKRSVDAGDAETKIAGAVDLSGSSFGALRLNGRVFSEPTGVSEGASGKFQPEERARHVRALGMKCGTLEFIGSFPGVGGPRAIPALDLSNASVEAWKLDDRAAAALERRPPRDLPRFLMEVLDRTKYVPTVYQNVESYLYAAAYEDESRVVRRDFVQRQRYEDLRRSFPDRDFTRVGPVAGNERRRTRVARMGILCALGAKAVADPEAGSSPPPGRRLRALAAWLASLAFVLASILSVYRWSCGRFVGTNIFRLWVAVGALAVVTLFSAETRAYVKFLGSIVNRFVSGNFTSYGRVFGCYVALFALSTVFFHDRGHLDVGASVKKTFFEGCSHPESAASPEEMQGGGREGGAAREVAMGVCRTMAFWGWRDAMLFTARLMSPVDLDIYGEVDVESSFYSERAAPETEREHDAIGAHCGHLGIPLPPAADKAVSLRFVNPAFVGVVVKVLGNILLTLFGATIASLVSRRPK